LREALLHLLSEGFVRSEVNRGFTVAPVSLSDFTDITKLRTNLRTTEKCRRRSGHFHCRKRSSANRRQKTGLPT
jgi:hypothetical protein